MKIYLSGKLSNGLAEYKEIITIISYRNIVSMHQNTIEYFGIYMNDLYTRLNYIAVAFYFGPILSQVIVHNSIYIFLLLLFIPERKPIFTIVPFFFTKTVSVRTL